MKKQLIGAVMALLIAGATAYQLAEQGSAAQLLTLFASAVAAGVVVKGAVDARRLAEAGLDPDLLLNPLQRRLRAWRRPAEREEPAAPVPAVGAAEDRLHTTAGAQDHDPVVDPD